MYELSDLGFSPFFENQINEPKEKEGCLARIAAQHRGLFEVWAASKEGHAQLAGRLLQELEAERLPGVGDWVVLKAPPSHESTTIIEDVLKRKTVFIRGSAGRQSDAQVVAANVDLVFIVCGLDNDYNPRRIERYLSRIWASGAEPLVVLNKADLCEDLEDRLLEVENIAIGVPVYTTSALNQEGLDEIKKHIKPGLTAALVGSSGAGKSTIINALLGEERMATKEISGHDGRGRHTTTHRQLILLPQGGMLIDTPGMRELQLFDEEGIETVFADIEELSAACRFTDCRHDTEPGCAVKEAVESGQLAAERLEHYFKLESEAKAYRLRHDEHQRRKSEKVWGQLYDEAKRIRNWKRGK
jgi:ribosome biogenesis GTPase